ncbi:MAG: type II secretion system F family protein [Lachnospiraceae bacterium]|nr:type II secretion system F family protein [Lachnospiraceae bacterium]
MRPSMGMGILSAVWTMILLVLLIKSRKTDCPKQESFVSGLLFRMGIYLEEKPCFQKVESQRTKHILKDLYPATDIRAKCREYYGEKIGKMILIFTAGCYLTTVLSFVTERDSILQQGSLKRGGYLSDDQTVELVITDPDTEESRSLQHTLLSQRYPEKELDDLADELEEKLPGLILGDNTDLSRVKSKLSLTNGYERYPFSIDWLSSDYALIDSDGSVHNTEIQESTAVTLTADLTFREYERSISFPVVLQPATFTGEEALQRETERILNESDEAQAEAETFRLPGELFGKKVSYSIRGEGTPACLFPVFCLLIPLLFCLQDKDLENRLQKRKKRTDGEYPAFVEKFVLLYGAGMSIRRIFERLERDDLQEDLKEQIRVLVRDLHNGILEQTALEQFGHRLATPCYIKFSGLLISHLKKGNTDLKKLLEEEAGRAFEIRRNLARKKGEEAGTKLLFPMILMLGVVMAVIILPAFLSF